MSLGTRRGRSPRQNGGPPAILIFIIGVALVFGTYYLWIGLQNFVRTGGLGVEEATQRAALITSATAQQVRPTVHNALLATTTPIPPCQDFVVAVPNAIVRQQPSLNAPVVTSLFENAAVCVLGRPAPDSEWYIIDSNPGTRRLEIAYMHQTVLRALNPTATPSRTFTPLPTVTQAPTTTRVPATATPLPSPTQTRLPGVTDTPLPTVTPTPTIFVESA